VLGKIPELGVAIDGSAVPIPFQDHGLGIIVENLLGESTKPVRLMCNYRTGCGILVL
jgi:hypothetical protein